MLAKHGNADTLSRLTLPESISSTPIPAETVILLDQMPVTAEHMDVDSTGFYFLSSTPVYSAWMAC